MNMVLEELLWILFKSYLSNRIYKVKINDTLSDAQSLAFGVHQGSILGPILYSLYVKDIEKIAENYSDVLQYKQQMYTIIHWNSSSLWRLLSSNAVLHYK